MGFLRPPCTDCHVCTTDMVELLSLLSDSVSVLPTHTGSFQWAYLDSRCSPCRASGATGLEVCIIGHIFHVWVVGASCRCTCWAPARQQALISSRSLAAWQGGAKSAMHAFALPAESSVVDQQQTATDVPSP